MGRGGHRDGAGRKSGWNHAETQTIRVPKVFAAQLMDIARQLDAVSLDCGTPFTEKDVAKKTAVPENRLRWARANKSEVGYNAWLSVVLEDSAFKFVYSETSDAYFSA